MASPNVPYITDAQFQSSVLDSDVPVLIDFTAAWCGPCKAIAPLLDQLADGSVGKLRVVKMDVDTNPQTPTQFGVTSIPALMIFKGGKLVAKRVGSLNKAALDAWVAGAV
jgi:thioredoxin 1